MSKVRIPVSIESLEEGGVLSDLRGNPGGHAEGETVEEALENIEDVARILLELQKEQDLPVDKIFEDVEPDTVIKAQLIEGQEHA